MFNSTLRFVNNRYCVSSCKLYFNLPNTSFLSLTSQTLNSSLINEDSKKVETDANNLLSLGLELLRSNKLDEFRYSIPYISSKSAIDRTKDNYFWILVEEYHKSQNVSIDVEKVFEMYLNLFPVLHASNDNDSSSELADKNKPKVIFSAKTIFNLLYLSYQDYLHYKMKQLKKKKFSNNASSNSLKQPTHIYERRVQVLKLDKILVLNEIEAGDSSRKRRLLHGAVLLANKEYVQFFDEFKMANEEVSINDVEYLCRVAKTVKEPRILESLIEYRYFLPRRDETNANIFNMLALLYGQKQDIKQLEWLWQKLLEIIPPYRLVAYRHALHRIRHFYRCANVASPQKLLKAIYKVEI